MRILLTNDDGIYAKGMYSLYLELADKHQVVIVAPESEQSAVGHALTLYNPLRVKKIKRNGEFYGYGVNGTPADCVKIAFHEIMKSPPDTVISGINLGPNVGINVLYSGTVSAATEGAILGIPSIAVSLNTYKDPDFGFASSFTKRLVDLIHKNVKGSDPTCLARRAKRARLAAKRARRAESVCLRPGLTPLLNVNIPAVKREMIRGIAITRQGTSHFMERFEKRIDPRDNTYYWQAGESYMGDADEDTDIKALANHMISITPLQYDLTCHKEIECLRGWKIEI